MRQTWARGVAGMRQGCAVLFFFLLDLGWSQDRLLAGAHRADGGSRLFGTWIAKLPAKEGQFPTRPSFPAAPRGRASRLLLLALLGGFRGDFLRDSVHRGGEVVRAEAPRRERDF